MIRLSITCSGHTQPLPPVSTVPSTRSLTPLQTFAYLSGMSSTFGFILKILLNSSAPVRSSTSLRILDIGTISSSSSSEKPSARPRFASGSASAARTGLPSSAYILASVAANVVFPTPPLPVIAIFIILSPHNSIFCRNQQSFSFIRYRLPFSSLRFSRSSDQQASRCLSLLYKQPLPSL